MIRARSPRAPGRALLLLTLLMASLGAPADAQRRAYVPGAAWERRAPEQVGMDAALLRQAVEFARTHETDAPRDLELAHYLTFGREPFGQGIGPFKPRGDPTGVILRNGYIVAEWGDPLRVDMTFSVTKSFLSTVVGLAYDRGLIGGVQDPVHPFMAPTVALEEHLGVGRYGAERLGESKLLDVFATEHNRRVTWDHLLRQTSDWEGTLWGKPDWADRPSGEPDEWTIRERNAPGTVYEYNDVRVNLLALAALNVWRRPLPQVLKEHVMDPIGASPTWRWYGYENSWVLVDGLAMQSVSGGGHWGGGMFINAYDQARFGLLTLRRGQWGDRRILSEEWFRLALTPTPAQPGYGFMNFFLNTGRERFPAAPEAAFAHLGNGVNLVYVDPVNDLVVVARWIDNSALAEFVQLVLAAVRAS